MGVWSMISLSTNFMNPRELSTCPFYYDNTQYTFYGSYVKNNREVEKEVIHEVSEPTPTLRGAIYSYLQCIKLSINARVSGFCDPTLQKCVKNFNEEVSAVKWLGNNADARESFCKRKLCKVDVNNLPWTPKEEYKEWLRKQGRLVE